MYTILDFYISYYDSNTTRGKYLDLYHANRQERNHEQRVHFSFEHEVTKEEVTLTLTDTSEFKERVSVFAITEANFENSTIGFWRYYVTQTESGADVVATGKMELTAPNLSTAGVVRYNGYNGDFKTYTTT